MIAEALASCPYFMGIYTFGIRGKPALHFAGLKRTTAADGVGIVTCSAYIYLLPHMPIALVVMYGHNRPVNGYFMKVRSAKADQLRIGIRKQAALHQRIVGEIYTGYNITYVESHLLCFCKKIIG